jgi:hypothetical protein
VLASLPHLIAFISNLNESITTLILSSTSYIKEPHFIHDITKKLNKIKFNGNPTENAIYISKIVGSMEYSNYNFGELDTEITKELIIFLYNNNQSEFADNFCHKMYQKGVEFLREIYLKHHKN